MKITLAIPACLVLAACVDSSDPSEGGFANGIAGITSGTYDARVEEREAEVEAEKQRNAALTAELASLRGEHNALKNRIIQQRTALANAGTRLSPDSERQIQRTLASNPDKVESLRKAIADARVLSERLAALAG